VNGQKEGKIEMRINDLETINTIFKLDRQAMKCPKAFVVCSELKKGEFLRSFFVACPWIAIAASTST
jgi:hypothetical protein